MEIKIIKHLYDEWVEKAQGAYAHATQFAQKERTIKDPTLTGETTKKGPNDDYKHPDRLTLSQGNWSTFLQGKITIKL